MHFGHTSEAQNRLNEMRFWAAIAAKLGGSTKSTPLQERGAMFVQTGAHMAQWDSPNKVRESETTKMGGSGKEATEDIKAMRKGSSISSTPFGYAYSIHKRSPRVGGALGQPPSTSWPGVTQNKVEWFLPSYIIEMARYLVWLGRQSEIGHEMSQRGVIERPSSEGFDAVESTNEGRNNYAEFGYGLKVAQDKIGESGGKQQRGEDKRAARIESDGAMSTELLLQIHILSGNKEAYPGVAPEIRRHALQNIGVGWYESYNDSRKAFSFTFPTFLDTSLVNRRRALTNISISIVSAFKLRPMVSGPPEKIGSTVTAEPQSGCEPVVYKDRNQLTEDAHQTFDIKIAALYNAKQRQKTRENA
ncbi:hypothetical protein C8R46DRAFT_1184362 [Mycena filopes]|nr:hypothetical protein C8R46DRAFT_1184362 [Mycena filopes]